MTECNYIDFSKLRVEKILYKDTKPFILNLHYAKRMPVISFSFGLFECDELIGVCTFGSPASRTLCTGIMGEEHKNKVLELNRVVLKYNRKNEASFFVSRCLKLLPKPKMIVSYSDSGQNHIGIIYQALNFYYTGSTKPRTDMVGISGGHQRHYVIGEVKRVPRTIKNRYVYPIGTKREINNMLKLLKYKILPYPKELVN